MTLDTKSSNWTELELSPSSKKQKNIEDIHSSANFQSVDNLH